MEIEGLADGHECAFLLQILVPPSAKLVRVEGGSGEGCRWGWRREAASMRDHGGGAHEVEGRWHCGGRCGAAAAQPDRLAREHGGAEPQERGMPFDQIAHEDETLEAAAEAEGGVAGLGDGGVWRGGGSGVHEEE